MRSDARHKVSPGAIKMGEYFLGPLAQAIVADLEAQEFDLPKGDAIAFALALLHTDVIAHANDRALFSPPYWNRTGEAINIACARAIYQTNSVAITREQLSASICSEILKREGYMRNAVRKVMIETFGLGLTANSATQAFWNYLGVTTDENGIFPLPW